MASSEHITDEMVEEAIRNYNRSTDYAFPQATLKEQRTAMREVLAAAVPPPSGNREAYDPHEEFDHFVKEAIDNAPEPLRRLGEYLADVLDEDEFPQADRLLLGIATSLSAPSAGDGWQMHPYEDWRKAVDFSLNTDEGLTFLRLWQHGEWDQIDRDWPEWKAMFPAPPEKVGA